MATDALRAFYHYYITLLLLYLPYYLTLLWHCSCQDRQPSEAATRPLRRAPLPSFLPRGRAPMTTCLQIGERVSVETRVWGSAYARSVHGARGHKRGRTEGVVLRKHADERYVCDFGEEDGAHVAWAASALQQVLDAASSECELQVGVREAASGDAAVGMPRGDCRDGVDEVDALDVRAPGLRSATCGSQLSPSEAAEVVAAAKAMHSSKSDHTMTIHGWRLKWSRRCQGAKSYSSGDFVADWLARAPSGRGARPPECQPPDPPTRERLRRCSRLCGRRLEGGWQVLQPKGAVPRLGLDRRAGGWRPTYAGGRAKAV
jgi:hypothetical protein